MKTNFFKIPFKRRILWYKMKFRRKMIPKNIKNKPVVNTGRDTLYQHLLEQELKMWCFFPEKFNKHQFEQIVDRRGFNIQEQNSLIFILYKMGFDITELQLVDLQQYREAWINKIAIRASILLEDIVGLDNTQETRRTVFNRISNFLTGENSY